MTSDTHNSLVGKGFSAAYLALMALMVVECSVKLPSHVKTLVELGLGAIALVGVAMIAFAHLGRTAAQPAADRSTPADL